MLLILPGGSFFFSLYCEYNLQSRGFSSHKLLKPHLRLNGLDGLLEDRSGHVEDQSIDAMESARCSGNDSG